MMGPEAHLVWKCPHEMCASEQLGDMDSPYDEYRCVTHQVDLVLSDRVIHAPDGRGM
jgi:hypothetical protein